MIKQLKPFFIALIAVFTMMVLQIIVQKFDKPLLTRPHLQLSQSEPVQADNKAIEQIRPKLEQQANDFQVKKTTEIIEPAVAGASFEQASAYSVTDLSSGQVLLEKNLSEKLPIASLTKIMTAVVILDLAEPKDQFTVSKKAAGIQPTKMGLVPQQKWNRDELLNALLLTSANDAAQALKENIDQKHGNGSFTAAMNEKAKFLGLKNTNFENPQGFDGKYHYSSVEDLTILTNYALKNYPTFQEIVAKDYQFYPANQAHKQADLYNWNGLLGVYPGVAGVKIGNTGDAGYTTVVLSEREGIKLLAVVLGAPGVLERDLWAAELLDTGFEKLAGLAPIQVTADQLKAKYASWQYFE